LSPVVTKLTITSSLFVKGDAAEEACTPISIVHQPGNCPLGVRSEMENSINCVASVLLEILTCPFTADVTIYRLHECINGNSIIVGTINVHLGGNILRCII